MKDPFAGPHKCRHCTATFSTPDKLERHGRHLHKGIRRRRQAIVAVVAMAAVAWAIIGLQPEPQSAIDSLRLDDDPRIGSAEAGRHLVVVQAPTCDACAAFHADVLPGLVARIHGGEDLAVWFVDAPAAGHEGAAIAQECSHAHSVAGYLDLTGRILQNRSRLDGQAVHELLKEHASQRGIPEEDLMRCYYAEETASAIEEDRRVAHARDLAPGQALWIEGDHVLVVTLAELA